MPWTWVSKILAVAPLLLLASCVTPDRAEVSKASQIRRVAVISLAAHQFESRYTGVTLFGNEEQRHDITAWTIDEEYEKQARNALATIKPFDVANVHYDRAALTSAIYTNKLPYEPVFRSPNWEAVEQPLKDLSRTNALDAVIVVARA